MYRIIFTKTSRDIIRKFIMSYKNNFLKTFTDTWIYYEDLIRQNYINNSKKFYNDILSNIKFYLTEEKILWYNKLVNLNHRISFIVWNYIIILEYSENIDEKTRRVEKLNFNPK
jgi:hypothetical protein